MITINGNPVAKARPRFARRGKFVQTYNDQETEESKLLFFLLKQWKKAPISGPVSLSIKFYMRRPKAHYGTGKNAGNLKKSAPLLHTKKPDLDNLVKLLKDVMNGVVFTDDSLVYKLDAIKIYSENPRTEIEISEVEK